MYEPSKVADKINLLLKEKNKTQKTMLEDCGLNKNAISTMLSRASMPKADNLAKIADYLDCSVDYLLGRTDDCTKIKSSTILAKKIKDTNIESDIIEDTSIVGIDIENTNIGSTYRKNNVEPTITENEAELLKVYRSLSFRDKHELMTIVYEMQDEANKI